MAVNGRRFPADERGSVLVVAMMVMGVAMSLAILIVTVSITSGRTSGQDRQRLSTIDAAEAGIDGAYASIQTSGLALPCQWPTSGNVDTKTYPDATSTQATITYYNAGGTALACTGGSLPTGSAPARAVIASIGSTGPAPGGVKQRKMEALINLLPVGGNTLQRAIYGNSGIAISNNALVDGNVGTDADLYSNGNFTCGNSPQIRGSIFAASGSITMNQTCSADGDVWALNSVTLSGNKTIGGNVRSTTSTITADGNTTVNGTLTAKGAIAWSGCSASAGKCLANQSAVPYPPSQAFPALRGNATVQAAWTAAGYVVITQPAGVACGSATGDWIASHAASLSQKTMLRTACAVEFRNTKDVAFAQDFALFADGGIRTSNQVTFLSSSEGTTRNLYMVIPYDATPPCAGGVPGMSTSNNFSSSASIRLLWYTPCDISYANSGESYGTIYGEGTVTSSNAFTLHYRPVTVYGIDPLTMPTLSYKVDIVYKREDRVS